MRQQRFPNRVTPWIHLLLLVAMQCGADVATATQVGGVVVSVDHDHAWLQQQTTQLVALITAPSVAPHIVLTALLFAMGLGALHAFSPGHGKTIVGGYLIGSRSTPRHAIFLGITVTVTHTLIVFAVGLVTLFASRYVLPDQLLPALSLLSGLLVLGMGIVLLLQRWRGARDALSRLISRKAGARRSAVASTAGISRHVRIPADRRFGIRNAGTHRSSGGAMHAHGGSMHSHLPPGSADGVVSWRGLLALGVSGGLVPCPSAMVLLLAAVALGKTFYGLLMVAAFSLGLAATLIAVGLVFLSARSRFRGKRSTSVWPAVLPAMSAVLITIVGFMLCYGALTTVAARALRA